MENLVGNEKYFYKRVCNREDRYHLQFEEIDEKQKRNGAKGGAPKGNQNARKKQPKTTQDNPNQPKSTQIKETKTETKTNNNIDIDKSISICAEVKTSAPPVISFDCIKGEKFDVSNADYDSWVDTYTALDVLTELKKMKAWLTANPKNKKTRQGMPRFITSWLSRSQDKAPRYGGNISNDVNKRTDPRLLEGWRNQPSI